MMYVWLIWSLILLGIWLVIYLVLDSQITKREMLIVSTWTSFLGLTEPLFVPAYWMPPSLFDLAHRTRFDIESLIFSFAIGGIVVILYEMIFKKERHFRVTESARHSSRHHYHYLTLLSAPAILALLLLFVPINPMYATLIALVIGGLATWYCRPDIKNKMLTSAALFLALYYAYFWMLLLMSPGYVEKVWNLKVLSGILITGIPLEELLFAATFGFFWSSVYEHLTWRRYRHI